MTEIQRLIAQVRCWHTKQSGGHDYRECGECGVRWDYRREGPADAVARSLEALLTSLPQASVQEQLIAYTQHKPACAYLEACWDPAKQKWPDCTCGLDPLKASLLQGEEQRTQ